MLRKNMTSFGGGGLILFAQRFSSTFILEEPESFLEEENAFQPEHSMVPFKLHRALDFLHIVPLQRLGVYP